MKAALLIGFGYQRMERGYHLPGIIIDLYRSYKWAKKIGATRIYILTDHTQNISSEKVLRLVTKGEIEGEAIFFIDRIRADKIYHNYINYDTLIADLTLLLIDVSMLFVYYSGHSERGLMLFPREDQLDRLPLDQVLYYSRKNNKGTLEIFSLLDCCESSGLGLPFRSATSPSYLSLPIESRFLLKGYEVLCISSGTEQETASARLDGSPFTWMFYRLLQEMNNDDVFELIARMKKEGYPRHPIITTNHPKLTTIWRWFLDRSTVGVEYDPIDNVFIIK